MLVLKMFEVPTKIHLRIKKISSWYNVPKKLYGISNIGGTLQNPKLHEVVLIWKAHASA